MTMLTAILTSVSLMVAGGSNLESDDNQAKRQKTLEIQSTWECSETVLEFQVAGTVHETESEYCAKLKKLRDPEID
ncbi:MAG: hypothetical protein ABJF89_11195 [Parasphingorhabdus sp.]|uniref:hypothetical protein n=2 Tax=Parasphingorhabdus sp. TaxID=2709688 RepID=UPI0032642780